MINNVTLVGRITNDLELRKAQNGTSRVFFTLACERYYRGSNDTDTHTDFIPIIAWGKQAENLVEYCKKGYMIGVSGSIQTSSYTNEEGKSMFKMIVSSEKIKYLARTRNEDVSNTDDNVIDDLDQTDTIIVDYDDIQF